jgi:tape measure domain-containing protein
VPENLNWNFNLMDGIRGPAAEMAASLEFLTKKLGSASGAVDELEKAMRASKGSSAAASGGLAEFGLQLSAIKELAGPLMEAGRWALEKGWDFEKKSIEALEFKENTLTSFQVLLGSAKEAQEFFNEAAWLGRATPFQTRDVVAQFQRLLSAGFTKAEVPVVFQAVGDAAAQRGFSTDVMNNITNALSHAMASGGHNMGRVLQMLQFDAAGTGFQRGRFMEILAKNLGINKEGVDALLSSGQVSGREFVKAFIDDMAETAGGGITGGGMKKMENTFRGIMNTLEGTFQEFFFLKPGGADDVKGFVTLKNAMMNVRDALNVTTPAGKALQDSVVGAFDHITKALFGTLEGPDGLANVQHIIQQAAVAFEDLADVADIGLSGMTAMVTSFLQGVGLMHGSAEDLFSGPMSKEELEKNRVAFQEFGKSVGEALSGVVTVLQLMKEVWDDVKPFFSWMTDHPAALRMLISAAPGGQALVQVADHLTNKTLERKAKQAEADMAKTAGAPGSPYYGPPLPPINVNVDASGHPDPKAVGEAAKGGVRSALQEHSDLMRKTAYQAGVH